MSKTTKQKILDNIKKILPKRKIRTFSISEIEEAIEKMNKLKGEK